MRKLVTLGLAGVLGVLLTAGDASACHKKKCPHVPAPVVCVTVVHCPPPPCPPPVKVCKVKQVKTCGECGGPRHGLLGRCHKKTRVACAPAPCPPAPCAVPVVYAYAAPQTYAAPQAMPQTQMTVPGKATPQTQFTVPGKATPQG